MPSHNILKLIFSLTVLLTLTGCLGTPTGIQPVENFDLQRYLGKWYEIARLDHSFERGLTHVTAEYSPRNDGGINVINSGFSKEKNQRKVAEGKAYFVDDENTGHLKVSFFGPFYGSYVIFELDHENYLYAFITSYNRDYLWLLAREPQIDPALKEHFLTRAKELGFDTSELIFVDQK